MPKFYIQGIGYPLAVKNGGLVLHQDVDLVRDGILSILLTQPLERVMRPAYGTPDQAFDAISDFNQILGEYQRRISQQIGYSGVTIVVTGEIADDGLAQIFVTWAVDGIPQPTISLTQQPSGQLVPDGLLLDADYVPLYAAI
jgi:hypothetical protein